MTPRGVGGGEGGRGEWGWGHISVETEERKTCSDAYGAAVLV